MRSYADRRVMRSKKAIVTAFLELLSEKDYNDITVTDIALRADVNRKTFYNYYAGIHEVADEIEDDLLQRFREMFRNVDVRSGVLSTGKIYEQLTALLCAEDGEIYRKLFESKSETSVLFLIKLFSLLRDTAKDVLLRQVDLPPYVLDTVLDYTLSGMLAVYQNWYHSDRSQPLDDVVKIVAQICVSGLNGLLASMDRYDV